MHIQTFANFIESIFIISWSASSIFTLSKCQSFQVWRRFAFSQSVLCISEWNIIDNNEFQNNCFFNTIVNLKHSRHHFTKSLYNSLPLTNFTACMEGNFSCCVSRPIVPNPRVATCIDPIAPQSDFAWAIKSPRNLHWSKHPQMTLNDKASIPAGTPKELKTELNWKSACTTTRHATHPIHISQQPSLKQTCNRAMLLGQRMVVEPLQPRKSDACPHSDRGVHAMFGPRFCMILMRTDSTEPSTLGIASPDEWIRR